MKLINVFHTRIEISPYELGECRKLENMCSYYDPVRHTRVYVGCMYDEDKETLIIPKGINQMLLHKLFDSIPTNIPLEVPPKHMSDFYKMTLPPRDQTQIDAIKFLSHKDEYAKNGINSQFGLNLDTGVGKTFGHDDLDNIKKENLEYDYDIFVVNHQTLSSFIKTEDSNSLDSIFKELGIGIKVYDEAHLCFGSILNIDMCTDVKYNYYLTATFGRGDIKEATIYKRAFASLVRYGENIEKRKHTVFNIMYFTSNASYGNNIAVQTNYGFNNYRYWNYCHNVDKDENIIYVLLKVINKTIEENIEGKILITSPMIESADYIYDILKDKYPDKIVAAIHSKKPKDENVYYKNHADIISTTIKSLGTGDDISGLRVIINLDPHSSPLMTKQLIGRLREYAPDKDTYFYDLVDISFKAITKMIEKRLPTINKICKEVVRYKLF